jgi:hypothetical protein
MLNMRRILVLGVTAVLLLATPAAAQFTIPGPAYDGPPGSVDPFSTDEYIYDSGVANTDVGLGPGSQTSILWAHHFNTIGGAETINAISTSFGSSGVAGGSGITVGQAYQVHCWDDPDGDGSPVDAVLLNSAASTVPFVDTDEFDKTAIDCDVSSGSFFIGAATVGDFPAPLDQSLNNADAWIDFNAIAEYNPALFSAALNMNDIGIPGVWLLRGNAGGGGPPMPASGTWGMIALVGLLMVGSLFFMRRRAEA